jgi:hypothetical protein
MPTEKEMRDRLFFLVLSLLPTLFIFADFEAAILPV